MNIWPRGAGGTAAVPDLIVDNPALSVLKISLPKLGFSSRRFPKVQLFEFRML